MRQCHYRATLGALPEMLQTAYGSLMKSLRLQPSDRLLIRGGTTSVGLAAVAIAKSKGAFVAATTRSKSKFDLLKANGVDQCLLDDGHVAKSLETGNIEKFHKCLELVGVTTLHDSLRCVKEGGIVCMTGIVGEHVVFGRGHDVETGWKRRKHVEQRLVDFGKLLTF